MEAFLQMYDIPEIKIYTDTWWELIRNECIKLGVSADLVEENLSRNGSNSMEDLALTKKLFLGQTCGWPLLFYPYAFQIIGTPIYDISFGNNGKAEYHSILIARVESDVDCIRHHSIFSIAMNSRTSLSGCLLPSAIAGSEVIASKHILYTGSHENSIMAVKNYLADVAAIDCVTYQLFHRNRPSLLDGIKIIGTTMSAPSLPYITHKHATPEFISILKLAIGNLMASPDLEVITCRQQLLLRDFEFENDKGKLFKTYENRVRELQTLANEIPKLASTSSDHGFDLNTYNPVSSMRSKLPYDSLFVQTIVSHILHEAQVSDPPIATSVPSSQYYSVWRTMTSQRSVRIIFPGGLDDIRETLSNLQIPSESLDCNDGNNCGIGSIRFVCFLGNRVPVYECGVDDHEIVMACWKLDSELVQLLNASVVVAYATAEIEPGGDWGNVVLFKPGKCPRDFTNADNNANHNQAQGGISPRYYSKVRIHRGFVNTQTLLVNIYRTLAIRYINSNYTEARKDEVEGESNFESLLSVKVKCEKIRHIILWDNKFSKLLESNSNLNEISSTDDFSEKIIVTPQAEAYNKSENIIQSNYGYSNSESDVMSSSIEAELDWDSDNPGLSLPDGYSYESEEYTFNFETHLNSQLLSFTDTNVHTDLSELGYSSEHIAQLPSSFAQSKSFPVLSQTGLTCLRQSLDNLDKFAASSPRIPKVLRGASLRSKFIQDFCLCPELTYILSNIARCALCPHPMMIMHGHTNLLAEDPLVRKESVDKWHRDTVAFVLVIFISEPVVDYSGGEFQFFAGTVKEAEDILSTDGSLPIDRIKDIGLQTPGHAVFQQGWQVYHRAAPVTAGSTKRTTFVLSYVASDVFCLDACTRLTQTYNEIDDPAILLSDWARFRCWKSQRFLLRGITLLQKVIHGSTSLLSPKHSMVVTSLFFLLTAMFETRTRLMTVIKTLHYGSFNHRCDEKQRRLAAVLTSSIDLLQSRQALDLMDSLVGDQITTGDNAIMTGENSLAAVRDCILKCNETVRLAIEDINEFKTGLSSMVYFK